ncbi:MAG: alpha-glucan family phosphorylase [Phycisphaerae bacterium]
MAAAAPLAKPIDRTALCKRLDALARNLWWSWNSDTQRLFASLDPRQFAATSQSPLLTLRHLSDERLDELANDAGFVGRLGDCEAQLAAYLKTRPWFDRAAKAGDRKLLVAYFCSEYAVHECMNQYAGGLGVLAGDHLKSVSDLGIPLVGVGLLYRSGYYQHSFRHDGSTRVHYPRFDYSQLPIVDLGVTIAVPVGKRSVRCKIWEQRIGRTRLFLLDSDVTANKPADRRITDQLYGGEPDHRIEQQVLLGVGGCIALDKLGLRPTVYHLNEGHAAFAGLERLRRLRKAGAKIEDAIDEIRRSTVFTTHTPVPAGHDRYSPQQIMKHLAQVYDDMHIDREAFLSLGRENARDKKEWVCMTVLALKLAEHCNGVAALHGDTSRKMWAKLYQVAADKVPIGHITNGVHTQTWLAPEIEPLYKKYLKPKWNGASPRDDWWAAADRIPAAEFWQSRNMLRSRMVNFIRQRLAEQIAQRGGPVEDLIAAHQTFDENALTIGFARRFATYKRAPLIFSDPKRLSAILNNSKRPVQLVFAGKAHPRDLGGQAFAQQIYQIAQKNGFRGRVVVLENYDMLIGRMLTSGSDVWLNNPVRPQEASGTSGMKPPLHGGINCSILDGWWPEAYDKKNGWAIGDGRQLADAKKQDRYDAGCIYDLIEGEIAPLFYKRDGGGVPGGWVARMVASMKSVGNAFSTHRMLSEYLEKYYLPAHRGWGFYDGLGA